MEKYKTWHWQEFRSWNEVMWNLMADVLTREVVAAFNRRLPAYIVGEDLAWLDEIVEQTSGSTVDTQSMLADRILIHYGAVRAFHGTRPLDKATFYLEGIHPLEPKHFEKRARELFLNGSFPELSEESIQIGIEKAGYEEREGRIYFEANETHLMEFCAHYMLYGSEYLFAIAANIPGSADYRQHLKKFGTPTIFECDIPLSLIGHDPLKELAGSALRSMFSTLVDPSYKHADMFSGAGLCISRSLPPEYIIGHKTPSALKDPTFGRRLVQIHP